MSKIYVIKANGSRELLDTSKIRKVTRPATEGLDIDLEELELNANLSFRDGMTSDEIQTILRDAALDMIDIDTPDATYAASRLELYRYYTKTINDYGKSKSSSKDPYEVITLRDYFDFNKDVLRFNDCDVALEDIFDFDKLNNSIVSDRDYLMNYLGTSSMLYKYTLRQNGLNRELPQHLHMRVAMFVSQYADNPTEKAIERYDMYSKLEFLHGTPTTTNGGTKSGNTFSCAVGSTQDTLLSIFDGYSNKAIGSKWGTGWGWDWSRVRATNATILGHAGAGGGLKPFLKIENDVAVAVDQLGTRLGAINVGINDWHMDVLDAIKMKENGGSDRNTAKELFMVISCHDEFMRREDADEKWTLFDPYDVRDLTEIYGDEFTERYKYYEELSVTNPEKFANKPIVIQAKELWRELIVLAFQVGNPSVHFIDNSNNDLKPDYETEGLIRTPNLCVEYLSPIKNDEITLCNLGSINLAIVRDDDHLYKLAYEGTLALDDVIDVATYRIPGTEELEKRRRSIGLGVVGEAESILKQGILYGSPMHELWIKKTYSIIQEASDAASRDLVKMKNLTHTYKDGFANMHRRCIAPTSTIAFIMGTSNAHLPYYRRVYKEHGILGKFTVVSPGLSKETNNLFVTGYELDQVSLVKLNGVRQRYIDMGISNDVYFVPGEAEGKDVSAAYKAAWESGNKTVYYCKTNSIKKDIEIEETDSISSVACFGCAG